MFEIKHFGIQVLPGNILNFIGIWVFFMSNFINLGFFPSFDWNGLTLVNLTSLKEPTLWFNILLFHFLCHHFLPWILCPVPCCTGDWHLVCLRLWGILFGHLPCLLSDFLRWVFTALGFPLNTTLATSQRFQESCASHSHLVLGNCSFPLWFPQWLTTH